MSLTDPFPVAPDDVRVVVISLAAVPLEPPRRGAHRGRQGIAVVFSVMLVAVMVVGAMLWTP